MIPWPSTLPDPLRGTRYRAVGTLAATSTLGTLVAVEHSVTKKPFVAKVLAPRFRDIPALRGRFVLEAQLLSQIDHPNVVRVIDAAELLNDDSDQFGKGCPFYVMEPLVGRRLLDEVLDVGPLTVGKAVRWTRRLASAVAAAHRAGIIHRDISPSSIFVVDSPDSPSGEVKFLGFGVDKVIDAEERVPKKVVEELQRIWLPHFVAPEILLGQPSNEQSDVFGLGLVLDFMLRGSLRFPEQREFEEVRRAQLEREGMPIDSAIVSIQILSMVRFATLRDTAERYKSVDELDSELLRFEKWAPQLGYLEKRLPHPPPTVEALVRSMRAQEERDSSSRRAPFDTLIFAAAMLVGLALATLMVFAARLLLGGA